MEDQEKALNLAVLFSPNATNSYSGAGANAVSRADRVFLTTPLSEVVWSPRKGLSIKCADLGSSQNTITVVQSCPVWSDEHSPVLKLSHKSALPGTFQLMNTMNDISLIDITRGDSPSEDKEKGQFSPRKNQPISNNAWASSTVNSDGREDGKAADCSSHEPKEIASNLAKVEAEHKISNKEPFLEHIEKDHEASNDQYLAKDEALVFDATEELACTTKFKDGKQAPSEDIAYRDFYSGTSHFTHLNPLAEKCAQTSDLRDALCSKRSSLNFLMEAKSEHYNQVMVLTPELSNKGKECIHPVCQEEKTALIESSINPDVNSVGQCKGKEEISSTERTRSVSQEKDDNYGSVKSSNSSEPFVTGKRLWSFGEEIFMGSKRMKKSSDENSCSGPHVKDSSFINWISSVTRGFFRADDVETHSLSPVINPMLNKQRCIFSTSVSNDSTGVPAHGSVGFDSILKAFHWSRLKGKSRKTVNIDHLQKSASSRELQLENLNIIRNTSTVNEDNEGIMLHRPVPISSVRIDQGVCQFGEHPPVEPKISVINSCIQQKVKDNIQEPCNLHNMGSSRSSLHNGSHSPSEGKETSKIASLIVNKSSSLPVKVDRIPSSVWISRFLPKVATPRECATQWNQDSSLEHEKHITECNKLQNSQNDIEPVKDCQNSEDCHHSPLEDQKPTPANLQQYSISPMGFCRSKKVHTDLKTISNLNPILPSQKLKKLEPMTSVFAKRLDAFRHIQTSEDSDDITPENATCFFCGKNGHTITSCSDVTESELGDLLKNTNSLGRAETSACLCLRCLQHNHWAVVCPYASLNSHQHVDGNASIVNCESFFRTTKGISDAPSLSNHGVRICEKNEDQQQHVLSAHRIHCGDMSRNTTDLKGATKGKQIASPTREAGLRDKSYAHFHDLVIKKKPDESQRIFERIRKLRLSRTDIIRWMESPTSHFSLEGFFLRVKLGKREEGQGGACYHVACISGASREKIYEGGKSHLPVDIGGLKCLIDCRFISNHDFVKDELKAWFSTTLQRGGQLPSEADLDRKLREREMLDL